MNRSRYTSGKGGRRPRIADTIKDIAYAISELTQAHKELCAVAAIANASQRDAAMIEPASRVGLAGAFIEEVEQRMGWDRPIRDVSREPFSDSSECP